MLGRAKHQQLAARQGFTLIELMVVVAMIGVLSALAIAGYRKYSASAGTSEALAVIQGIRNAEETYKAETMVYLGCSCGGATPAGCPGGGSLSNWYPMSTPTSQKWAWSNPANGDQPCWQALNVVTDGPVRFGYAVIADVQGPVATPGMLINPTPPIVFPNTPEPWYLIQAAGDRDADTNLALLFASSFQAEVYVEDDTE